MKVLIAEACLVVALGQELAAHADVGETVDVSKDDALSLARMGRAFYVDKVDDPTKGQLTAQADDKDRIAKQAKSIAAAQKEAAARSGPTDFGAMLAAGIAEGIAKGMQAIQAAQAGTAPANSKGTA